MNLQKDPDKVLEKLKIKKGGCGKRGGAAALGRRVGQRLGKKLTGKKSMINLKKKLTPEVIQESCKQICDESIKEYPKVLEMQAKLLGKIDKKKKDKLVKKFAKECHPKCEKTLHEAKEILPMMDKLQKQKDKSKNKTKTKKGGGKRTVRKSKVKGNKNSSYFEFKKGSSRKFWRITKKGTKIITQYGRFGSLGQMTTKEYGSKVDQEYDKLIQSKKKKGYVEKWDFGSPNPKKPMSGYLMKLSNLRVEDYSGYLKIPICIRTGGRVCVCFVLCFVVSKRFQKDAQVL